MYRHQNQFSLCGSIEFLVFGMVPEIRGHKTTFLSIFSPVYRIQSLEMSQTKAICILLLLSSGTLIIILLTHSPYYRPILLIRMLLKLRDFKLF